GEVEDYGINITGGGSGCSLEGQACDDGDECSSNDVYDANCICNGVIIDANNNGIPDPCEPGTGPGSYCEAVAEAPWQQYISRVELEEIDQSSGKCALICGYGDFTNQSASLERGNTYTLTLTASYSWQAGEEYWRVWIDWNGDQQWTNNELVFATLNNLPDGIGDHHVEATFTVPDDAFLGTHRMRIALSRASYAEACGQYGQGEVEDYSIDILAGTTSATSRQSNAQTTTTTSLLDQLKVFPNPTNGRVFLTLDESLSKQMQSVSIYNSLGQLVIKQQLEGPTQQQLVYDLSKQQAGVYYLVIRTVGEDTTVHGFPLIKQ
ncbi:MAG: GEVED domain-containing protein, partial [Bacteroidota bacterium]